MDPNAVPNWAETVERAATEPRRWPVWLRLLTAAVLLGALAAAILAGVRP